MTSSPEMRKQNALSAITETIIAGNKDIEIRAENHNLSQNEFENLIAIIFLLKKGLVAVQPDPRYARQLKKDLTGKHRWDVDLAVPSLPMHVKFAAALALAAGFLFVFLRRFLLGNDTGEIEENPILQ